ncbi:MAG TPA: hypothetical protein VGD95_04605 [Micavibrio sp.]
MPRHKHLSQIWGMADLISGAHRPLCLALTEMSGFQWVCSHLHDAQGARALYYVARKAPAGDAGQQIVNLLNKRLHDGVPLFEMAGPERSIVAVKAEAMLDAAKTHGQRWEDVKDIRRVLVPLIAQIEMKDVMKRLTARP